MEITREILNQLGGNKFIAMTGSKNFLADGNTLRMTLVKNESKANRLFITLDETDTYTMKFLKITAGRVNKKTYEWTDGKNEVIQEFNGVYEDQLQTIFTSITGMDTHL
ncbi:hypothetical protein [Pelosinus sp. UFO1]|uniref:hypothetical protein n=1 Tax=Pelosinus sp. UFO1 TaxID=484770 RepID=UPI0004D11813|nr:hypothetical protein [Pelosinus sp. UFO1]AIF52019.1 hypothetical protein UFO1_2472 [Pelosinus sp. UFO1]